MRVRRRWVAGVLPNSSKARPRTNAVTSGALNSERNPQLIWAAPLRTGSSTRVIETPHTRAKRAQRGHAGACQSQFRQHQGQISRASA